MTLCSCELVVSPVGPDRGSGPSRDSPIHPRTSVKRLAPLTLALLVLPSLALAAGDPNDETERLNRADMALAKRAAVQKSDLSGWRLLYSGRPEESDVPCTFEPDLSAFVITGEHEMVFEHMTAGTWVVSGIVVFRNVRDAVGDFNTQAKPGLMRCLRSSMLEGVRKAVLRARIASSRMSTTPRIGSQSVSYHLVATISAPGGRRVNVFEDRKSVV